MGILWRQDIVYDNVLILISDAAPYILKAISVVCPKMINLICVAHAFHRAAEIRGRAKYLKVDLSILSVKKVFSKLQ